MKNAKFSVRIPKISTTWQKLPGFDIGVILYDTGRFFASVPDASFSIPEVSTNWKKLPRFDIGVIFYDTGRFFVSALKLIRIDTLCSVSHLG